MASNSASFNAVKCQCKIIDTGNHAEGKSNNVLTLKPHGNGLLRNSLNIENDNFLLKVVESFYEKCAAYNLRYCPIKGYKMHDNYLWSTMKDVVILVCFMMANFVVFLAIFTQTVVHIYHVLMLVVQWVRKSIRNKMDQKDSSVMLQPRMFQGDHTQSSSHRIF